MKLILILKIYFEFAVPRGWSKKNKKNPDDGLEPRGDGNT